MCVPNLIFYGIIFGGGADFFLLTHEKSTIFILCYIKYVHFYFFFRMPTKQISQEEKEKKKKNKRYVSDENIWCRYEFSFLSQKVKRSIFAKAFTLKTKPIHQTLYHYPNTPHSITFTNLYFILFWANIVVSVFIFFVSILLQPVFLCLFCIL